MRLGPGRTATRCTSGWRSGSEAWRPGRRGGWFAGGKRMFVMFADHHHDDRVAFWAAADEGVQRHLVEDEPDQFFRPPYVGARGWVGMWLDNRPDWDRVELLVEEAWRCIAGP